MAIPEEDLGPAWMRDYGYVSIDIDALNDISEKLTFEHGNFEPHLGKVVSDMMTPLPPPSGGFIELVGALQQQHAAQKATLEALTEQGRAIDALARAAKELSARYRSADAFSAARAADVDKVFADPSLRPQDSTAASVPPPGGYNVNVPPPGGAPTNVDPSTYGGGV
jgi:hypothetical protein